MLYDYYVDELILVLDAYAEMHKNDKDEPIKEYYADEI